MILSSAEMTLRKGRLTATGLNLILARRCGLSADAPRPG
jgi:hypothetical protein